MFENYYKCIWSFMHTQIMKFNIRVWSIILKNFNLSGNKYETRGEIEREDGREKLFDVRERGKRNWKNFDYGKFGNMKLESQETWKDV